MTIYERKMAIKFNSDSFRDQKKLDRKVQSDLFDEGLSLTASYAYGTPSAENYGFREIIDEETTYSIVDDNNQIMMTLAYSSQADRAIEGLDEYGIEATIATNYIKTSSHDWKRVRGEYLVVDEEAFELPEGAEQISAGSMGRIQFEDGTVMKTKFEQGYSGHFTLKMVITYEAESVTDRKNIEFMLVETPLSTMKKMRKTVTDILQKYSDDVVMIEVDCETSIKSEANYECTPETTKQVLED